MFDGWNFESCATGSASDTSCATGSASVSRHDVGSHSALAEPVAHTRAAHALEPEVGADAIPLRTNPFATRWTRPGAVPFQFTDTMTIDDVVRRLLKGDWRGAIVGPHGSGKSTLLAMLLPATKALGKHTVIVRLHDGQWRLPLSRQERKQLGATDVLVIDGYEQLGRYQRWRVSRQCRRQGCGLLVTSHSPCDLPILFCAEPSLGLVERLIERCLPPHEGRISSQDIERAWQRHAGNVREVFFELYDRFEAHSPIVRITTELPAIVTCRLAVRLGRSASTT
jgi:hypothetical protein